MITQVELRHFKCFKHLTLPLAELTFLSGANGSGKSSVLQSLALLHQTMREHEWSTRLVLNGGSMRLGTVSDVVDKVHGRHSFEIGLVANDHAYSWTFSGERGDMSMQVERVEVDGRKVERPGQLKFLLPFDAGDVHEKFAGRLRKMTYLSAERIGPREFYPLEERQNALVVGPAGEYAVALLHQEREQYVSTDLEILGTPPTLLRQTEARMDMFFPGCCLGLEQVPRANAVILGLGSPSDSDLHRPVHVGFGLTQVLPIIVACLSAKQDDVLLIENPEVHLHPAGQARMGFFLAEVVRSGVQVILETHSDHVLNGIRRAVKAGFLSPEQTGLHFFRPRKESAAQVVTPLLDHSGNIDVWPEGFFDQFDKDMNHFAGWEE
jgi:predicted ATPase